jgi:hypothetical protein
MLFTSYATLHKHTHACIYAQQAVLKAISNVPLNDAVAAVLNAESEQFKALATGELPGREKNLLSKYHMDTHKKADRASYVLSEKPKQSADHALQLLLTDLRDSASVKTYQRQAGLLENSCQSEASSCKHGELPVQ